MQSTVRPRRSANSLPKSNIGLPVAIRAIEKALHILLHRGFQRREACVVTCIAQILDPAFGEILISAANLSWHIDILDIRLAPERLEHGGYHVAETARIARADIEDTADRGRLLQP